MAPPAALMVRSGCGDDEANIPNHNAHVFAWMLRPHPKSDERHGWEKARHIVDQALGDLSVQQCDAAMQMLGLLSYVFHQGTPTQWMSLFDAETQKAINRHRANEQHAPKRKAKEWAQEHYRNKKDEYATKAEFGRDYTTLIAQQFGLEITAEHIAADWLRGM